ncbi:MAG TPA: hypothetical protein VJV03_01815 [Pyrinomonadaceae bacterium]|nr:hypothetical protein [Pyrinomonadaceae bacterium]
MQRINWIRLIVGALVAAIILFVSDGLMHESWLHPDWLAVYHNLRATTPEETPASMIYFAIFELGRGFTALMIYVLMRDRFTRGPKTAVLAALITWIAFSLTGPAQFIPLGFFSNALWIKMAIAHLVTTVIATVAGAAIYKSE